MTRSNSAFFAPLFASKAVAAIFSVQSTLQSMLDAEAALARAEAKTGTIPQKAANAIEKVCRVDLYEIDALGEATAKAGNPVIPLAKTLTHLAGDAGGYVHWGATSQDIFDTGLVLQMRKSFKEIEMHLESLCEVLASLATRHRNDPMAGRTFMQHALPITFGFRAANWLSPMLRHTERLKEALPRILTLQFSGAGGTLASLGADGDKIAATLGEFLDLPIADTSWHTARDRIAEAATWLALLAGSLNKIATDIALLAQTEIGELAEPEGKGRGGSSTMPQKRNPVGAAAVMMALAPKISRDSAHQVISAACKQATKEKRHLKEIIGEMPEAAGLEPESLDRVFDPSTYFGNASQSVDRVLAHHQQIKSDKQ